MTVYSKGFLGGPDTLATGVLSRCSQQPLASGPTQAGQSHPSDSLSRLNLDIKILGLHKENITGFPRSARRGSRALELEIEIANNPGDKLRNFEDGNILAQAGP